MFLGRAAHSQETGAAFLKIEAGARAIGMGSAFTAMADDASALFWNPAGIARLQRPQLLAMHSEWVAEMNHGFMGYGHPFGQNAVGIAFSYLAQGRFQGRGDNREREADFSAADQVAMVSFSHLFGNASVGTNLKFLRQQIASEDAQGMAVDLGTLLPLGASPFSMGLTVQNLGPRMQFSSDAYNLPLTLSGGLAYRPTSHLAIAVDVRQRVYTHETNVSLGTEFLAFGPLSFRTGYLSQLASLSPGEQRSASKGLSLEKINGFSAGLGIKFLRYSIDYAVVPYAELGNAQQISLSANF
jgi:hypothetical protein